MRASSTRDPIRLGRKPGIVRTSQRPLTDVRQVTNDGPRSWPAHTLPLALPAPDQGVTARPGGSAPVGGGPRHREVSSATQVAGSVRGTKPPNRCRARHRTRSAPPRPEPDPFAPAFARRKRTMARACDHCAAHRCGLGEPRSDPPDRAGTGNVTPHRAGSKVADPAGRAHTPPVEGTAAPDGRTPRETGSRCGLSKSPLHEPW